MISEKEIRDIAKLSYLNIEDNEIEKFQNDFSSVLEYFNKLKEVDLTEIKETSNLSQTENIEREDIAKRFDKSVLINSMPKQKNDYLEVKKVLHND